MYIDQLSVFIENKPGRLAEITKVLGENGINIRALSIADTTDYGVLRLIANDPQKAQKAIKDAGYTSSLTKVIAVGIDDSPGGISIPIGKLFECGVTVEYMYAFVLRNAGTAYVVFRVDDNEKAVACLKTNGFQILGSEEVGQM